jgi:hypothetical protein
MPIGLRPGVSFCEASGHFVFLDLRADRYFGLSESSEAAFRRCVHVTLDNCNDSHIENLVRCGLLVDAADAAPLRACTPPPRPRASVFDGPLPRAKAFAVAAAIAGLTRARLQLRVAGLASALGSLAARKPGLAEGAQSARAASAAAATFRQSALLVRTHDQCLVRSLALAQHLASRGEAASLVIGVQVRPFSAHAWVQQRDLLLNETCDGVRCYTPILVL